MMKLNDGVFIIKIINKFTSHHSNKITSIKRVLFSSIFIFLITFSHTFAQTSSFISYNEINQPNGVAGLDSNGNVTARVKSTEALSANSLTLKKGLKVGADPAYTNNSDTGRLEYPRTIDTDNTSDDFLMGGGHSDNDVFGMKLTGMNLSGGDLGGVLYEFDDRHGYEGNHRSDAGTSDGVNVAMSIADNPGLDVIGGGVPSADGVTYTLSFPHIDEVCVAPALSAKEKHFFRNRIRVWTNIAQGMANTEGVGNALDAGRYDLPNYYYGYHGGFYPDSDNKSCMAVSNYFYPGTKDTGPGFRTVTSNSTILKVPGANAGDTLDNEIAGNTNYHSYRSPALFLGGSEKAFNQVGLELYQNTKDSITRNYDNEFDHFIVSSHDREVVTRGFTYSWGGSNHRFADGSYMGRMAGFGLFPVGLIVDGVADNGGVSITTDAGFTVFRNKQNLSAAQGSTLTASLLGVAGEGSNRFGQLAFYGSQDGSDGNGSLHLGLTKASTNSLTDNRDATCADTHSILGNSTWMGCSAAGQIVFDPQGYQGGIALGTGAGKNANLGLVVTPEGDAVAPKSMSATWLHTTSLNFDHNGAMQGTFYPDNWGNVIFDGANLVLVGSKASFEVYGQSNFHRTISASDISATGTVSTDGQFRAGLRTPTSSHETCKVGAFSDDTNYHYVCVSDGKWKRVALSDF